MTIDFTTQEAQFIFDNLSKLTIPVGPNAAALGQLSWSVLSKIQTAAEADQPVPDKAPLASAAKTTKAGGSVRRGEKSS